jgi:hypothetical protein
MLAARPWVEWLNANFLRRYDRFVVPGKASFKLPSRFMFFAAGWFRGKVFFDLLSAYAKLVSGWRFEVGLVLAGDGISRQN